MSDLGVRLSDEDARILTAPDRWLKRAQCGPCSGHSPSWDGHDRDCPERVVELVRAQLENPSMNDDD